MHDKFKDQTSFGINWSYMYLIFASKMFLTKRPVNAMVVLENILCLYPNFVAFGKCLKILIALRILTSILLIVYILVDRIAVPTLYYSTDYVFFFGSSFYSIFVMGLTVYYSKTFMKLLAYSNLYKSLFDNELCIANNTNVKKNATILFIVYSLTRMILDVVFVEMQYHRNEQGMAWQSHFFDIYMYISFLRFKITFPVIYCFMYDIADRLNCITSSVNAEIDKRKIDNTDVLISNVRDTIKLYDRWSAGYKVVKKMSDMVSEIFGTQIRVILITITTIYIATLYEAITTFARRPYVPSIYQVENLVGIIEYILGLYLLSTSAQRVQNSAKDLKRKLTYLNLHSFSCVKQYKATRDFLRLLETHPVKIAAFGSVSVDMGLMPACLDFCVSYTVIALQFSNVL